MTNKILIIEDDAALRTSIVQTLELEGLDPIPTVGFTQARRSIRSNFRGVILTDIKMPNHSGFDVLQFVQDRDPDLPVIMITGHSDVPTAMRAIKEGAYDYLEKPCDPDVLVDTLKRALDHRHLVLDNRDMRAELDEKDNLDSSHTLSERLENHEKLILEQMLSQENGKVAIVADRLGLPRNTLYDRMAKYGLVAKAYRAKS